MNPARDEPSDQNRGAVDALKSEWDRERPKLDERRRRLWAAERARKIGRGGISLVSRATGLARDTIRSGIAELSKPADQQLQGRVRAPGGGRKPLIEPDPGLAKALDALIGPSEKAALRWTTKSTRTLAQGLNRLRHVAGERTIAALLHSNGYELRSRGGRPGAEALSDAEAMFEHLHAGVVLFHGRGDPVIVVEVFQRRSDGDLKPTGRDKEPGSKVVTPVLRSLGPALARLIENAVPGPDPDDHVNWRRVKIDQEAAAFAAASIRGWWREMGRLRFGKPGRLLVVADGGNRDSRAVKAWQAALQRLVDEVCLVLKVRDLPSGTIRWGGVKECFLSFTKRPWGDKEVLDRLGVVRVIGASGGGCPGVRAVLDGNAYPRDGVDAGPRPDADVAGIIGPTAGRG